jgi:hypothetical protein
MHLETLRTDYRFVHLSPQVWFLRLEGCRVPRDIISMDDHGKFIVRGLESLGLPPQAVPHENRSCFDKGKRSIRPCEEDLSFIP